MQWLIDIVIEAVLAKIQGTRFHYVRADTTLVIESGHFTRVHLNAPFFDTKTEWNDVFKWWIAKETGYYQVSYGIGFRFPFAANKIIIAEIRLNDVFYHRQYAHTASNQYNSASGSLVIYVTAGQRIDLWAYHNTGIFQNLDFTNNMTYLSIARYP